MPVMQVMDADSGHQGEQHGVFFKNVSKETTTRECVIGNADTRHRGSQKTSGTYFK